MALIVKIKTDNRPENTAYIFAKINSRQHLNQYQREHSENHCEVEISNYIFFVASDRTLSGCITWEVFCIELTSSHIGVGRKKLTWIMAGSSSK